MNADLDRQVITMFFGGGLAQNWAPERAELLLGLREGARISSDIVVAALRDRLAIVQVHPLAATPQGEHMRRMLNAAASALLRAGSAAPPRLPTVNMEKGGVAIPKPGPVVSRHTGELRSVVATSKPQAEPISEPGPRTEAAQMKSPEKPRTVEAKEVESANSGAMKSGVATDPVFEQLVRRARGVLAAHGGPSEAAIQELLPIVMSAGMAPSRMPELLIAAMGQGGGATAASSISQRAEPRERLGQPGVAMPMERASDQSSTRAERDGAPQADLTTPTMDPDPTKRLLLGGAAVAMGAVILVLVGAAVVMLLSRPAVTPAGQVAGGGASGTTPPSQPTTPNTTSRPAPDLNMSKPLEGIVLDASELKARLDAAAAHLSDKPAEAVEAARIALASAAGTWDRLSSGDRTGVGESIVDLIYKAAADEGRLSALLAILSTNPSSSSAGVDGIGAEDVRPFAFYAGVLWRLARERELPASALTQIDSSIRSVFANDRPAGVPGINSGIAAAMRLLPARIARGRASASATASDVRTGLLAWRGAVQSMTKLGDEADRVTAETIAVDALERVLNDAGDPAASRSAYEAIMIVAGTIQWEAGSVARPRLVLWLGDPRYSNAQLNLITGTIVRISKVEGLDDTAILAGNASPDQRAAVRDAYLEAWKLSAGLRAVGSSQAWSDAARIVLSLPTDESGDQVSFAVLAAQFNSAAALRVEGKGDDAAAVLSSLQTPGPLTLGLAGTDPSVKQLLSREGGENSWASRYLNGDKSLAVRLQRIHEIENLAPAITQLDADVLAELAFSGSPPEVSAAALAACVKFAPSATMTHALLKALPKAPRREAIGRAIDQVTLRTIPPVYSDKWLPSIRRALVERLLEQMAAQSVAGRVDQACVKLAECYATMATGTTPPTPDVEKAAAALQVAAEQLYGKLRSQAGAMVPNQQVGLTIDVIDRRREARRMVALGPIQFFAADQVAIFEMTSYIAASEKPESVTRLVGLMASVSKERQGASSILEQLRVVEQGVARVWAERLGVPVQ